MWIDPRIQGEIRELIEAATEVFNANYSLSKPTELSEKALVLAQERNDPFLIAEVSRHVAMYYSQLGEYDKSFKLFTQTIEYAEKAGEHRLLASTYRQLGMSYHYQHNYIEAERSTLKSIQLCEEHHFRISYIRALNDIAMVYRLQSRFHEALDYSYRARTEFENTPPDTFDIGERTELNLLLWHRLATILYDIGDLRGTINIYENCVLPLADPNLPQLALPAYSNMGTCYTELGEHDKAITYFLKTRNILSIDYEIRAEIHLSSQLCNCYLKIGKLDEATVEIEKAYQLSLQTPEHCDLAYILSWQGGLLLERNDSEGINLLLRSAELYHKSDNKAPELRDVLSEIWKYYKNNGAYEQGLPYLDEYIQITEAWEEEKRRPSSNWRQNDTNNKKGFTN